MVGAEQGSQNKCSGMKGFGKEMSKIFRQYTYNTIEWKIRVVMGGASN